MSETNRPRIDSFYDVVIVGSGPAGASAARELVRSGRRVLIIEKKKLPRYKICSGLIQDDAQDILLEKFGTPPPSVFCRPPGIGGMRSDIFGICLLGVTAAHPERGTHKHDQAWVLKGAPSPLFVIIMTIGMRRTHG